MEVSSGAGRDRKYDHLYDAQELLSVTWGRTRFREQMARGYRVDGHDIGQVYGTILAARGRALSVFGMALALMRNYDPFKAPTEFKLVDLLRKFDKFYKHRKERAGS